jgi:hypothetical protein
VFPPLRRACQFPICRRLTVPVRTGFYREVVALVVLGVAIMLIYAVVAAWMAVVARRDPGRIFYIGKNNWGITPRDVTAAEWIRRYVPWGLGGGLVATMFGLLVMSLSR